MSYYEQDRSGAGCAQHSRLITSQPSTNKRLKKDEAAQSVRPYHSLCTHVYVVHGFSRRTLRKPDDSFASNAKRLSIFCIWTRACIVLLAFGTSLLCSASSCFHATSAPCLVMFMRDRERKSKIESNGVAGEQTQCGKGWLERGRQARVVIMGTKSCAYARTRGRLNSALNPLFMVTNDECMCLRA